MYSDAIDCDVWRKKDSGSVETAAGMLTNKLISACRNSQGILPYIAIDGAGEDKPGWTWTKKNDGCGGSGSTLLSCDIHIPVAAITRARQKRDYGEMVIEQTVYDLVCGIRNKLMKLVYSNPDFINNVTVFGQPTFSGLYEWSTLDHREDLNAAFITDKDLDGLIQDRFFQFMNEKSTILACTPDTFHNTVKWLPSFSLVGTTEPRFCPGKLIFKNPANGQTTNIFVVLDCEMPNRTLAIFCPEYFSWEFSIRPWIHIESVDIRRENGNLFAR